MRYRYGNRMLKDLLSNCEINCKNISYDEIDQTMLADSKKTLTRLLPGSYKPNTIHPCPLWKQRNHRNAVFYGEVFCKEGTVLKGGMHFRLGDGSSVNPWKDWWIPSITLMKSLTDHQDDIGFILLLILLIILLCLGRYKFFNDGVCQAKWTPSPKFPSARYLQTTLLSGVIPLVGCTQWNRDTGSWHTKKKWRQVRLPHQMLKQRILYCVIYGVYLFPPRWHISFGEQLQTFWQPVRRLWSEQAVTLHARFADSLGTTQLILFSNALSQRKYGRLPVGTVPSKVCNAASWFYDFFS